MMATLSVSLLAGFIVRPLILVRGAFLTFVLSATGPPYRRCSMFVGLARGSRTFVSAVLPGLCWLLVWDGISRVSIMPFCLSSVASGKRVLNLTKDEWKPPRQGQG